VCIGVALAGTSFAVVYGALSRLVAPAQRGRTLGLAGAAGGLGQFLLVPAAQGLLGWGTSLALVLLSALLALALPLALALRERPQVDAAAAPAQPLGQAVREAFGHSGFWLLNLGFLACGFQLAFIATHLPAYLMDRGLRAADGMLALAVIALANVVGTYLFGRLGDTHSKKSLLAGIYLARTAAMALFVLLPLTTLSLCVFAAVMGLLWLGTVPLTSGIVSQVFGVRYTATLFGFVFLGHQLGAFFGVWLGGVVFEATHSYDWIWRGAMALGLLAAALHWRIDERQIVRAPMPGVQA
jgi:predicted MFS family arabinose efflux permease